MRSQSPPSPSLAVPGSPSIGETKAGVGEDTQSRGKWAALTFLVLPRALGEEQLVLSIWEVGWKKLIHEGAGRKDKAGWQTEPPWATVTDALPRHLFTSCYLPTASQLP